MIVLRWLHIIYNEVKEVKIKYAREGVASCVLAFGTGYTSVCKCKNEKKFACILLIYNVLLI